MNNLIRKHPLFASFALAYLIAWFGSTIHSLTLPKGNLLLPGSLNLPSAVLWRFGPFQVASSSPG